MMTMKGVAAAAAVLVLGGCASMGAIANTETVTVRDAAGETVGTALLTPATEGVQVVLSVNGLPAGVHGVHIHETGRCEAPSFTSAGGHYNPLNREHGFENPQGHHVGDLPNMTVGADGRGSLTAVARGASLTAGAQGSLRKPGGTALVIHAGADDYRTNPSGDSGSRIACGVISPA